MAIGARPDLGSRVTQLLGTLREHVPAEAAEKVPTFLDALPDPVGAIQRLIDFYRQLPWKPRAADFDGRAIYALLTAFGNSRYLSNVLLNSPALLGWVLDPRNLERTIPAGELRSELGMIAADANDEAAALELARFKTKHMLRIAMRDLLSVAPLADIALELSNLADVIIQGAHDHIRQQLVHRYGRPLCPTETGQIMCNFAVFAMGKLGGSELNYSSDIDLMYIYTGNGTTSGPKVTTNADFAKRLALRLTNILSFQTRAGFIYRVDLRLRPEGRTGELVLPVSAAVHYYFNRARDWELQMLLKARPAGGDLKLGRKFLDRLRPRIYQTTTDFSQIDKIAETRDRIQQNRRGRGGPLDVKLDPGGIRDVEFLVQCLQRLYGGQDRFLRSGGTMYALHRLKEKGYLAPGDYGKLFNAYRFLRKVEHRLQMADNRQTHELPRSEEAVRRVAMQMGVRGNSAAGAALREQIQDHRKSVREIYHRVIGSQRPAASRKARRFAAGPGGQPVEPDRSAPVASSVWRTHLPQLRRHSRNLAEEFDLLVLRWGNRSLEQFLGRIVVKPKVLAVLEREPDLIPHIGELMEYSPYFARYLLRFPQDVAVIAAEDSKGESRSAPPTMHPELEPLLVDDVAPAEAASKLRLFFRRRMLAIQTRSICRGEEVFTTMSGTSELAGWILRAAHALAVREVSANSAIEIDPSQALRVIALGRLGMREFDLGSDADLVFVIPDAEASRRAFWTQVAKRIIGIVSGYTADGQMFTIDPRLRPMGRDGELVQTEGQFLAYFSSEAESWEAITYMKARTIAGDAAAGTVFLERLQEDLWQRFARRENLAELLVRMRRRLEAEQGDSKPLRSAPGGYYDIDFILLYWRLLHAESFYESLNTPERIEIIRKTDPSHHMDLDLLLDATTVYRALDHGVRVYRGAASHALPPTEWQRRMLEELLVRWVPYKLQNQSLEELVDTTMGSVRNVFNSAFSAG